MRLWHYAIIFLGIAAVIFFPSLHGELIMDDWGYITLNPHINATSTPLHFWFSFNAGPDYWPLSYTFYWIFYRLFGSNPTGYHVINILVHACNATLVLALARKFIPRMAPWAALLFLVHPLHVQAVSWIIQFKTLLATGLVLGTILCYLDQQKNRAYVLFGLSLLAKSSGVFVPLALLALVGKKKDLLPFFAMSALGGAATLWSNHVNFTDTGFDVFHMAWYQHPLLMLQNLMFYVSTFFVPHSLAYIYPYIVPNLYAWTVGLDAIALAIGAIVVTKIPRLRESAILLACYLILLLPCLGLVPIPNMKLSLVADHWAYLPDVFLIIFVLSVIGKIPWRWVPEAVTGIAAVVLAALAFQHAHVFATEEAFWRRSVELNPGSPAPRYNLGTAFDKQNRTQDALNEYAAAVRINPLHARAWYNMGRDHYLLGNLAGARESFSKTIELDPKIPQAFVSLSKVHQALLQDEKAIAIVLKGLEANPSDPELAARLAELQKAKP